MSSEIKYKCNFCSKKLTTKSVNHEHMGYCFKDDKWDNNLFKNLDGPHLCHTCLNKLFDYIGVKK